MRIEKKVIEEVVISFRTSDKGDVDSLGTFIGVLNKIYKYIKSTGVKPVVFNSDEIEMIENIITSIYYENTGEQDDNKGVEQEAQSPREGNLYNTNLVNIDDD